MEQTSKALITLMEIYDRLRFDGRPARNEPEFRAYQLLVRPSGTAVSLQQSPFGLSRAPASAPEAPALVDVDAAANVVLLIMLFPGSSADLHGAARKVRSHHARLCWNDAQPSARDPPELRGMGDPPPPPPSSPLGAGRDRARPRMALLCLRSLCWLLFFSGGRPKDPLTDLCGHLLQVQHALALSEAFRNSDYAQFFKLTISAGYLPGCLAHLYFHTARAWALKLLTQKGSQGYVTTTDLADMVGRTSLLGLQCCFMLQDSLFALVLTSAPRVPMMISSFCWTTKKRRWLYVHTTASKSTCCRCPRLLPAPDPLPSSSSRRRRRRGIFGTQISVVTCDS